uniref:Uncharacterized protein n=1 Tax=Mus spicilegus TaxID=10103 RepID=A0A8C6HIM7_MUSSI
MNTEAGKDMKHGCDLCCVTCASADGLQGSSSQGTDLFRHYQQHIQEENKKKNKKDQDSCEGLAFMDRGREKPETLSISSFLVFSSHI